MTRILFHFDANAVNARQLDVRLNELERLAASGSIELEFSEIGMNEASHGSTRRQLKTDGYTFAELSGQTQFEVDWRTRIANAVFPTGVVTPSQSNDVEILLTAKLSGAILVTSDGASKGQSRGILGSRQQLAYLGITVLSPQEAVVYAKSRT